MPQGLSRSAGLALALALPGILVVAALFGFGALDGETAIVAGVSVLALAALLAAPFALSFAAARAAILRLGPGEEGGTRRDRRLSLAARAIWPSALRLQRAWRIHTADLAVRLAEAEEILAAAPDPLILIDRNRRIVRANAAAIALSGPLPGPRDLAAALRNPALLAAADAVLRGERRRSVEFAIAGQPERVLRADIARIADRAAGDPSRDGAVAILALYDLTALRRAERMRADFIANAGHELKTPLTALIGFIETLRGPAREDPAARARFLEIMHAQAQRMARLVDDLLSLSRIELSEHLVPLGRLALAPLIAEVAQGFELRAAESGVRIDCALPDNLPDIVGDRDELTQVFQNLIDNAVKYARADSEVTVSGGLGSGAAAGQVWIAVTDQGEGIASEHLPRLTERFYRVDNARSRELGGTGLGLAIVKHILNRHRGQLEIKSRPGQGSTFTVWLRVAAAEPAVTEPSRN